MATETAVSTLMSAIGKFCRRYNLSPSYNNTIIYNINTYEVLDTNRSYITVYHKIHLTLAPGQEAFLWNAIKSRLDTRLQYDCEKNNETVMEDLPSNRSSSSKVAIPIIPSSMTSNSLT